MLMKLLTKPSINLKINVLFLLSVFAILLFASIGIYNNYKTLINIKKIEKTSSIAIIISSLVHETQKERGLSSGYLGSNGNRFYNELDNQIKSTNKKINQFNKNIRDKSQQIDIIKIDKIRKKVKNILISQKDSLKFYSKLNDKYLHFILDIVNISTDAEISRDLISYFNFLFSKELLGIQRAVVTNVLAKDTVKYEDRITIYELINKQEIYTNKFLHYASKTIKEKYYKGINSKKYEETKKIRKILLDINKANHYGIDSKYWFNMISNKINFLNYIDKQMAKQLVSKIDKLKVNAKYNLMSYTFISTLILIFLLILKYFTSKTIKKTLKDLDTKTKELNISLESFDKKVITSQTDTKGKITYVSDAFCKVSGYDKYELLGQNHSIIRHPDMDKKVFLEFWNDIENNKIWKGELKNKTKTGGFYWVDVIITIRYDEYNNLIGYGSIAQNITDKKAIEELSITLEHKVDLRTQELEKERYFIDKILNSQEQLVVTTKSTDIKSINQAFMNFYNITSLKEFKDKYNLISATFNTKSNTKYLQATMDNKIWTHYVMNNPNISHRVSIIKEKTEYIFSVTVINVNIHNEELEMIVLNDITELENTRQEIEKRVEDGLIEIKTLNDEIVDTQKEVIFTMGSIGETRSKETGNHVKRVAEYSKLLAIKYGIDEKEAELLKQASPMHDIGKVAIPDKILNKPGELTNEEFEKMKEHSKIGYDMLKSSNRSIIKTAAIVAIEHHERYDGKGYPNNLKGEEIHIYGRITAIADVFDALGSDRCYKDAWSDERIFKLLKEEKGKHFDPLLVDIFFANIDLFLEIRKTYKDI